MTALEQCAGVDGLVFLELFDRNCQSSELMVHVSLFRLAAGDG